VKLSLTFAAVTVKCCAAQLFKMLHLKRFAVGETTFRSLEVIISTAHLYISQEKNEKFCGGSTNVDQQCEHQYHQYHHHHLFCSENAIYKDCQRGMV